MKSLISSVPHGMSLGLQDGLGVESLPHGTSLGSQDGLGVKSLRGSGLIAGGTSRAYNDIFAITLVTARSVGIGA